MPATSIELFSGGGGLAQAMAGAGFHHLLVNEINGPACDTLVMNKAYEVDRDGTPLNRVKRGSWPLYRGSVSDLDFTRFAGLDPVIAGGVPCQPWSLGGKHQGFEDERNLWPELFRCQREARPIAVIAENVKGIARKSFSEYREYILRELSAPFEERVEGEDWRDHDKRLRKALLVEGDPTERYDVSFAQVDAADYGVPQNRERVFVIAFRKDLGLSEWVFPAATHSRNALLHAQDDGSYWERHGVAPRVDLVPEILPPPDGKTPWMTLRDAIAGLPEPPGHKIEHPDWLHHVGWDGAREYPGHTANDLDKPAKTVKAGGHGVAGGELILRRDNGSIRYMTVREVARVMSFPDTWRLAGPRSEQMRQLGNAVPVRLARVIADAVAQAIKSARGA